MVCVFILKSVCVCCTLNLDACVLSYLSAITELHINPILYVITKQIWGGGGWAQLAIKWIKAITNYEAKCVLSSSCTV